MNSFSYTLPMKFLVFIFVFVLCVTPSAFVKSAENTITIIHEDGSKDVVDLHQPAAPVEAKPEMRGEPKPETAPVAKKADPAPKTVVKEVEPAVQKPAVKQAALPKAEKTPVKTVKKKKAAPPPPKVVTPPPLPVQRKIQSGAAITRGKAISIALAYAPPSSDVEVFSTNYEGVDVFAVVFKTEDGFHEVLIDNQTGKVLESRESAHFNAQASPGHLPARLR